MRMFASVARDAAILATGRLGWMPAQFWDCTPAELRLVLEGCFGLAEAPLGRRELDRLRERLG